MSALSEIYDALMAAKASNESLESWQVRADARDLVRHRQKVIERGIAAYDTLQRELRDGRKYIEPPENYRLTSCQCNVPNAAPPCSWCTDPARVEDEASAEPQS